MTASRQFQTIGGLLVILSLVALPGCTDSDAHPESIRAAYGAYHSAVDSGDGASASNSITQGTLDYFGDVARLTRAGTREQIQARPLVDQALILSQRMLKSPEELKALDARIAFRNYVESMGEPVEKSSRYLSRFEFEGDRASAIEIINGTKTPSRVEFIRENEGWKYDLQPIIRAGEKQIRSLKKQDFADLSDDQFLQKLLREQLGKDVPETIWNPQVIDE